MSSYEFLFGSSSSDDEDEVVSDFTEFAWNAYQAYQPKRSRRYRPRHHVADHNHLVKFKYCIVSVFINKI